MRASLLAWFAAALFAAMARAMSNDEVVTVVHPHLAGMTQVLEKAAREFEAARGWRVNITEVGWGSLSDYILTDHKRGDKVVADIVTIGSTWAPDFYEKGIMAPLGAYFTQWRRERGHLGSIENDMVKGLDFTYSFPGDRYDKSTPPEWHAVPMDVDTRVFFYRKDLFRKWLKHDAPPQTIDEALRIGQIIRDGEMAAGREMSGWAVPTNGEGASDALQVLVTFIIGNGSTLVGPYESCTFEDEHFKASLQRYTGLYRTQHNFYWNHSGQIATEFRKGRVAMLAGAAWQFGDLRSGVVPEEDIGIGNIPAGALGPYTFQGGSAWAIPWQVPGAPPGAVGAESMDPATNKRKRAFDFIAWITDPQNGYLKDMVLPKGLIPGYHSGVREAKVSVADGAQLGGLVLYDPEGNAIRTEPAFFSNPDGSNSAFDGVVHPVGNLATGRADSWIDYNKAGNPVVEITFPRNVTVSSYAFVSGGVPGYERDPFAWEVSVRAAGGGWEKLAEMTDKRAVPLLRWEEGKAQPLPAPATARAFRFQFFEYRESMCQTACQSAVDMFPFSVPLQYPHRGFYKFGRVEINGTVDRMLRRLHDGHDIDAVAAKACMEWVELMRDPPKPGMAAADGRMWAYVGLPVAALVVMGVALVCVSRRANRKITRLKNDNEIAEELADAVALMNFQECEYLERLQSPTRIQLAFQSIIRTLKEYRTYFPPALLVQQDPSCCERTEQHVAIAFTDIKSSTSLWARCEDAMAIALEQHNSVMRRCIADTDGYEIKTIGDAFMIRFPTVGAAVEFGLGVQRALAESTWPEALLDHDAAAQTDDGAWNGLRVRVGVNYGSATQVQERMRIDYVGNVVNVAARVEGQCVPGAVCVTEAAMAHLDMEDLDHPTVIPMGERELYGVDGGVALNLLVPRGMTARAAAVREQLASFTGKSAEPAAARIHIDADPPSPLSLHSSYETRSESSAGSGMPAGMSLANCREHLDRRRCAVARTLLDIPWATFAESAGRLLNIQGVVVAVLAAAHSTGGVVHFIYGATAVLSWQQTRAVDHTQNAFDFVAQLERVLAVPGLEDCKAHTGIASGHMLVGNVGSTMHGQRFTTLLGPGFTLAELLSESCTALPTTALFACLGDNAALRYPRLRRMVRPVDVWAVGAGDGAGEAVVYEVDATQQQRRGTADAMNPLELPLRSPGAVSVTSFPLDSSQCDLRPSVADEWGAPYWEAFEAGRLSGYRSESAVVNALKARHERGTSFFGLRPAAAQQMLTPLPTSSGKERITSPMASSFAVRGDRPGYVS